MRSWPYRHHLSMQDRVRRSVYELLRDQMDMYLIKNALVDSYENFSQAGEPYPLVSKRELKPRARVVEKEYLHHNRFLVLFCEGTIPGAYKKYVRFFDTNKVTKEGIAELANVQLHKRYTKNLRYFENPGFEHLVLDLLPGDYALLIQKDSSIKTKNRYVMTHFRVKIDWPIDDATEDMARKLRHISKDLYESGEKYAQSLHHKLFENYGFHYSIGGRRTAAVVASQFLKKMRFISTLYVASSEDRTLTRISERGVSKFVLIRLPREEVSRLSDAIHVTFDNFVKRYLVDIRDDHGTGILQVVYHNTTPSKAPEDGKLRKLQPDYQWLTVSNQLLIPLPGNPETYPLPYSTIYMPD